MKQEWKKGEKNYYLPSMEPTITKIPRLNYFTIQGKGNPNSEEFSEKVSALYSLSYAVRMMPKTGFTPDGYFEYTVYPLEGIWDLSDIGKQEKVLNKEELLYTIMIRQPDFVTQEIAYTALETVKKKKANPCLENVLFEAIEDGLCVQMMHIGSFDDEPISFAKMNVFLSQHHLERRTLTHREIYISNVNNTEPANLKTVLRYFVK